MSSAIGGVLVAVFRRVTLELGANGRLLEQAMELK
jgi:hypothetical protein